MKIQQLLTVVGLEIIFFILAVFLVERSIEGALKAVKVALKSEFTTDTGRVNLIGMILLVFVYVFSDLHEMAANALAVEKPAPSQSHLIAAVALFGLGFIGSLICVLLMEKKK